ncbi:hypothetical protein L6452_06843 [Arctium lappa]|uniref:Uncharacterized protein n=1 Tax=Arctium lappa TaxID=4217 RepID=A0ACB9EK55_ARCLA|nr:hypothetical protein L6452_06843 [Arctium lappa]
MLRSNPAIPRHLSWPQVPDTEMTYVQKPKQTFNYSMSIPHELIVNYVDPSDDSIIQYCLENDLSLDAAQAEPSHDEQATSFHVDQEVEVVVAEQEVEAPVANQQIDDVLAAIVTTPVVHDDSATTDDTTDGDGDRDADVGDDIAADEDDDNDGNDDDQPSLHVYERIIREPEVHVQEDVISDEESVPINTVVANIQVDELDLAFTHVTAPIQSQAPATSLSVIPSLDTPISAVELSSVQARVSSEKFTTLNEINSDDDDNIRYEKLCNVKEEEYEDIVVISDTEDDSVFMDAKDEEISNTLYGDLPSQEEIPEVAPTTSIPAADTTPTTTSPSGTFEVGQSSRAQADVPPSDPGSLS